MLTQRHHWVLARAPQENATWPLLRSWGHGVTITLCAHTETWKRIIVTRLESRVKTTQERPGVDFSFFSIDHFFVQNHFFQLDLSSRVR